MKESEVRSSDPAKVTQSSDGIDSTMPEKSPDVQVEGEPLGSPTCLGALFSLACDLTFSDYGLFCRFR